MKQKRISQATMQQIESLNDYLDEAIGRYVELRKCGVNYRGFSPFVEERTPSFFVKESDPIWKCFSSGNGGRGIISFVMAHQEITFLEAIKTICYDFNITIEYEYQ